MLVSNLTGCANFSLFGGKVDPIEVKNVAVEKTPLNIDLPGPIKAKPFDWYIITPENAEGTFKRLEEKGNSDLVFFAITSDGYQQLAVTISELRNLITTQRQIIIKYKEYYEATTEDSQEKK